MLRSCLGVDAGIAQGWVARPPGHTLARTEIEEEDDKELAKAAGNLLHLRQKCGTHRFTSFRYL